jgi:hypothetical protein
VGARRDQLVLGAAAAALLVLIVAFGASGGVRDASPPRTPTPLPVPPHDQKLFGGDLVQGVRYSARVFTPAVSFTVGDGDWIARDTSDDDYLLLERRRAGARQAGGEYPGRAWLVFSRLPFVYDPRSGESIAEPRDLYRWMRRHPDLAVGPRTRADRPGVTGEWFTSRVRFGRPAVFAAECILPTAPCTAIAPNRSLPRGAWLRTFVPPTGGPLVIDVMGASRRDLDEIEAPAAEVLRSLRIG